MAPSLHWAIGVTALLAAASFVSGATEPAVVGPSAFLPGTSSAVLVLSPKAGESYRASLISAASCGSSPCTPLVSVVGIGKAGMASLELLLDVPTSAAGGAYNLTVIGEALGTTLLSQEVQVRDLKPLMLLETDKPVYKPGSSILVRSVCLMPSLKPCSDQQNVRFVLTNPNGDKVLAVEGTQASTTGVFEGTLQLDTRSPVGAYTITADGDKAATELTVSVEEYVLPKFEVTVDVDQQYIMQTTKSLSGKVDAKYSYGKGVDGTVLLTLKKELPWQCQDFAMSEGGAGLKIAAPSLPRDCQTIVSEIKDASIKAGVLEFDLPIASNTLDSWGTVQLEVMVTDSATGEQANATTSVELRGEPYHEVSLTGPEVYYPGLYADFEVSSKMSDGQPVDGEFLIHMEFETYLPNDYKFPGGEFERPSRVVQQTVTVSNGEARARVRMPSQPQCCLDAAQSAGEKFNWSMTQGCCWSVVNPQLKRLAANGKAMDDSLWGGNCMEPAFPPTATYVSVERPETDAANQSYVTMAVMATGNATSKPMFYIVTANGLFVKSSLVQWQTVGFDAQTGVTTGTFRISKSAEMVPSAHVVVSFIANDGTLAAGETSLTLDSPEDVKLLAPDDVTISGSQSLPSGRDYYEPGEEVEVSGTANPSSIVFIGGVDRSVSFLNDADTRVTATRLLEVIRSQSGYPEEPPMPGPIPCAALRALSSASLRIAAPLGHPDFCLLNNQIQAEESNGEGPMCYRFWNRFDDVFMPMMAMDMVAGNGPMPAPEAAAGIRFKDADNGLEKAEIALPTIKVRTKFPETWIWKTATVDASTGRYSFVSEAPDSITTWDLAGFSVSPVSGLGLSPSSAPAEVRVFKPLFVDIKLPYKVVRGETLQVVASVFNYLPEDVDVQLALMVPAGEMSVNIPSDAQLKQLRVAGNSAASFTVDLEFNELGTAKLKLEGRTSSGNNDAIVRTMKVVPEGLELESSLNIMLEPDGAIQQQVIPVQVADVLNLVPGSEYATLTLAGELLGPTLAGLGSLVQLPTGCGEQNMLLMAPTVYVMRYLNARQEARPEIREKALNYIQVGYSRELQYKHSDGSFSAFGTSDDSGSTWLTAFVLKVFSQAQSAKVLEVGENVAHDAASWLINTSQDSSGQFIPKGRVIHSEMVGGVNEDTASVSLTAFVTGALLEAQTAGLLPVDAKQGLSKALAYLLSAPTDSNYAKVLVAHTLSLAQSLNAKGMLESPPAGLSAAADKAFKAMLAASITEGTTKHWAPTTQSSTTKDSAIGDDCSNCYVAQADGPEVEMTGYALSTMITTLGNGALADGFSVAKWLLAERSPTGGWRSTQDTTVALEGLSSYAAMSTASPPDMQITVRYPLPGNESVVERQLTLNPDNYDILQSIELPVGLDVNVTVEGTGRAILTVGTVWHTKAMPTDPTFVVKSVAYKQKASTAVRQKVGIQRLKGSGQGMIIGSIQVFSGMAPRQSSLDALKGSDSACNGAVKRVDYANDEVAVYIDQLSVGDKPCELEIDFDQEAAVSNLKPAAVEVYEYYQPSNSGAAQTPPPEYLLEVASASTSSQGPVVSRIALALASVACVFVLLL